MTPQEEPFEVPTNKERFEHWFFETLNAYQIDYEQFDKPVESLLGEIWKGETQLKKVVHDGIPRLLALRHSILLELTYLNPVNLKTYRFGETYREFPVTGKRATRFPKERLLSETICAGDGEDGFRAALRCLAEEAGITRPEPGLLLPKMFHGDLVQGIPGAYRHENQALFIRRESDAFKGLLSGAIIREYGYTALPEDWDGGRGYLSVDEYGVTTFGEWYAID